MSLMRLSGEAFRRHARVFRTRGGLQHVKKVEADRLLDLHGTAVRTVLPDIPHPYIAAAPKIVHILLLSSEQLLKSLGRYAIHSPVSTAAEFLSRSRLGGVVNHVFGELDWTVRPGLDCEGNLAEVVGVDGLVGMGARGLQRVISGTCHRQAALFRRMAQHDTTFFRITRPW